MFLFSNLMATQPNSPLFLLSDLDGEGYLSDDLSLSEREQLSDDNSEIFGYLETPPMDTTVCNSTSASRVETDDVNFEVPLSSPTTQLMTSLPDLQFQSAEVDKPGHFIFPHLENPKMRQHKRELSTSSPPRSREARKLEFHVNPSSKPVKPFTSVSYICDATEQPSEPVSIPSFVSPYLDPTFKLPPHFRPKSKDWEKRLGFFPHISRTSVSGMPRIDLFVYAIEANHESRLELEKSRYRRSLNQMETPIERF